MTEASIRKKVVKKKKVTKQTKEKKVFEIKETSEFQDLCSTCAGTPDCASRTPGYPVYYCEDHDYYDRVSPQPAKPIEMQASQGLCVNCEKRDNCSHSSREGGVWHCEEYC